MLKSFRQPRKQEPQVGEGLGLLVRLGQGSTLTFAATVAIGLAIVALISAQGFSTGFAGSNFNPGQVLALGGGNAPGDAAGSADSVGPATVATSRGSGSDAGSPFSLGPQGADASFAPPDSPGAPAVSGLGTAGSNDDSDPVEGGGGTDGDQPSQDGPGPSGPPDPDPTPPDPDPTPDPGTDPVIPIPPVDPPVVDIPDPDPGTPTGEEPAGENPGGDGDGSTPVDEGEPGADGTDPDLEVPGDGSVSEEPAEEAPEAEAPGTVVEEVVEPVVEEVVEPAVDEVVDPGCEAVVEAPADPADDAAPVDPAG